MAFVSESYPRLLKLTEAAAQLGLGYPMMWRLAKQDRLPVPVVRFGSRMFVAQEAIDELLAQRKPSEVTQVEQREDGR